MDVNVKSLRRDLALYLSRIEEGEEFTVTRNGRAIAKLVPVRRQGAIDIEALRKHQEALKVTLDHNPVLQAREQERY